MGTAPSVNSNKSSPQLPPAQPKIIQPPKAKTETTPVVQVTSSNGGEGGNRRRSPSNGLTPTSLAPHMPSLIVTSPTTEFKPANAEADQKDVWQENQELKKENLASMEENQTLKQDIKALQDEIKMLRQQKSNQVPQDFLVGPPRTVNVPQPFEPIFKKAEAEVAHFFQQKLEEPRTATISILQDVGLFLLH